MYTSTKDALTILQERLNEAVGAINTQNDRILKLEGQTSAYCHIARSLFSYIAAINPEHADIMSDHFSGYIELAEETSKSVDAPTKKVFLSMAETYREVQSILATPKAPILSVIEGDKKD